MGSRFVYTVRSAIIGPDDSARDMCSVCNVIGQYYNNDAFQQVIYTESHGADANEHSASPK
jgi:1,4-alpha-glucan branching enzyme